MLYLDHEIDIPQDHPGLIGEESRKHFITLVVKHSRMTEKYPNASPENPVLVLQETMSDSAELAAFLYRNTNPGDGILAAEDHGPVEEVDVNAVKQRLRRKYDLESPDGTASKLDTKQSGLSSFGE